MVYLVTVTDKETGKIWDEWVIGQPGFLERMIEEYPKSFDLQSELNYRRFGL
jgi:hypothetical protein